MSIINLYVTQDDRKVYHFGIGKNTSVISYLSFSVDIMLDGKEATDIAVDNDGSLYILSEKSNWLLHLSHQGNLIRKMDLRNIGIQEAEGIDFDFDGNMWILSDKNNTPRLTQLARNGMVMHVPDLQHLITDGLLRSPQGIAIDHINREDGLGRFWIVDNAARNGLVLNLDDSLHRPIEFSQEWKRIFKNPQGISIANDGTIWLAGYKDGVGYLQELARDGTVRRVFEASAFGSSQPITGLSWTAFSSTR